MKKIEPIKLGEGEVGFATEIRRKLSDIIHRVNELSEMMEKHIKDYSDASEYLNPQPPKQEPQYYWCKHIKWKVNTLGVGKWFIKGHMPHVDVVVSDDWNECPVCGSERITISEQEVPKVEEPKHTLAERFARISPGVTYSEFVVLVADEAKKIFRELVEEHFKPMSIHNILDTKDNLLKKLEQL